MIRSADDFDAIRRRMGELATAPPFTVEDCPDHIFPDSVDGNVRCTNCGLHRFHLPAVQKLEEGS